MRKIKLTVDGKEVPLTDDQLRTLGLPPTRNNPFERVKSGQEYFYLTDCYGVLACSGLSRNLADRNYEAVSYFNDKNFAEQVYLRQLLQRKLLRFTWNNGYEATDELNQFYVSYFPKTKSYVVQIDSGVPAICPKTVDKNYAGDCNICEGSFCCADCRDTYWSVRI